MAELKNCPFCRGIAVKKYHNRKELFGKQSSYPYIQCCTCGIRTELVRTEEEAEIKWPKQKKEKSKHFLNGDCT